MGRPVRSGGCLHHAGRDRGIGRDEQLPETRARRVASLFYLGWTYALAIYLVATSSDNRNRLANDPNGCRGARVPNFEGSGPTPIGQA